MNALIVCMAVSVVVGTSSAISPSTSYYFVVGLENGTPDSMDVTFGATTVTLDQEYLDTQYPAVWGPGKVAEIDFKLSDPITIPCPDITYTITKDSKDSNAVDYLRIVDSKGNDVCAYKHAKDDKYPEFAVGTQVPLPQYRPRVARH
jgi:hypothetical protein